MNVFIKRFSSAILIPKCFKKSKKFTDTSESFVFISLTEHIGDVIAAEPVSRLVKEMYPTSKIFWVIKDHLIELVKYNPLISGILPVLSISEWFYLKMFLRKYPIFDLHISGKSCDRFSIKLKNKSDINMGNFHKLSLLEAFSLSAGLPAIQTPPRLYFPLVTPQFNLPEKYIVIHTLSNQIEKNWDKEKWQQLIRELPEISFVEVGSVSLLDCQNINYINLCGKTGSFSEIASIISRSTLFLGIDSAFAHFANALNKSGVILFGGYLNQDFLPFTGYYKDNKEQFILRMPQLKDITVDDLKHKIRLILC